MLTPDELKEVMKEIYFYSYDIDVILNEDEKTYQPSELVCEVDNIKEVLKKFTLPF